MGRQFLVRVTGKDCGRSRFVEARRYLTPWRCQAKKFSYAGQAEAFVSTLAPAAGQTIEVVAWEGAWHEELPDDRWVGCPKIEKLDQGLAQLPRRCTTRSVTRTSAIAASAQEAATEVTTVDDIVRVAAEVTFNKPLVTNVFRSVLVEAIVAAALPDWDWCSRDYASCDLRHKDSTRLEVKQSAARQTWFTGRASRASWDIRPRTGYWGKSGWVSKPGRYAHIYVLAHHPVVNKKADHRDARQWLFYVVATSDLPTTKTLSEAGAASLADPLTFEGLAPRVEALRTAIRKRMARKQFGRSRRSSGKAL